jgi:hypothetical protein
MVNNDILLNFFIAGIFALYGVLSGVDLTTHSHELMVSGVSIQVSGICDPIS